MKPAPLLVYTVLRLLAFLVPLAILWFFFPIFREFWWLAAIFAALIGTSISMLFLRRPLSEASTVIHERRQGRGDSARQADADAEDSVLDGAEGADARESAASTDTAAPAEPETKA
ncbi:DUF4229 domain-containing protein [Microbacterium sp.]|uniref:DUF4229 domain-containing protein n=1 Tax=Microbacterium sp. TaxID=51671 RepID=UPI002FE08DCB